MDMAEQINERVPTHKDAIYGLINKINFTITDYSNEINSVRGWYLL